jgi:hypothetical protein
MKFKSTISLLLMFFVPMMHSMEKQLESASKKKRTDISATGEEQRIKEVSLKLINAVKNADLEAIQKLLNGLSKAEQKEVINYRTTLGDWALRRAVTEAWNAKDDARKHNLLFRIIEELIERGGNVDYVDSAMTRQPLLMVAIINEDFDVAKLLLELGADPAIAEHPIAATRYVSEYNLPDAPINQVRKQMSSINEKLNFGFGGKYHKPYPPGTERDALTSKLKKLEEIKKLIENFPKRKLAKEKREKEAARIEEQLLRPESVDINFLKQLGRK